MIDVVDIISVPAVSGVEYLMKNFICTALSKMNIQYKEDNIGNIIIGTGEENLLVCAHMDEVGAVVTGVLPNGLVCGTKVGGTCENVFLGRTVRIYSREDSFIGVVDYIDEQGRMFINMSIENKELIGKKISIGCGIAFNEKIEITPFNNIIAPGLDNKLGIFILLNLIKKNINTKKSVAYAFTVGEETSKIGMLNVVKKHNFKKCICIDATPCFNEKDKGQLCNIKLGLGPVINLTNLICNCMNEKFKKIAEINNINIQEEYTVYKTHTDADISIENMIDTILVSYPIKRMHTASCECSLKDIDACSNLLNLYLELFE